MLLPMKDSACCLFVEVRGGFSPEVLLDDSCSLKWIQSQAAQRPAGGAVGVKFAHARTCHGGAQCSHHDCVSFRSLPKRAAAPDPAGWEISVGARLSLAGSSSAPTSIVGSTVGVVSTPGQPQTCSTTTWIPFRQLVRHRHAHDHLRRHVEEDQDPRVALSESSQRSSHQLAGELGLFIPAGPDLGVSHVEQSKRDKKPSSFWDSRSNVDVVIIMTHGPIEHGHEGVFVAAVARTALDRRKPGRAPVTSGAPCCS